MKTSLVIFFLLFSASIYSQDLILEDSPKPTNINELDKAPVFENCKGNKEQKIRCLKNSVNVFINQNFNFSLFEKFGMPIKERSVKANLVVNTEGNIYVEFKGNVGHPGIKREFLRIFYKMKIKPAIKDNLPVTSRFTTIIYY